MSFRDGCFSTYTSRQCYLEALLKSVTMCWKLCSPPIDVAGRLDSKENCEAMLRTTHIQEKIRSFQSHYGLGPYGFYFKGIPCEVAFLDHDSRVRV